MIPFEHLVRLDRSSPVPLYRQIAAALVNEIRNGLLGAGTHLPGSRELAKILQVHRKTVVAAYEELAAQDWIQVHPRKHVMVSQRIPLLSPQKWKSGLSATSYQNDLTLPFRHIAPIGAESSAVPELMIDDGYPDIRLSPIDELLKNYRFYTSKRHTIKNANIGTLQGTVQLRAELARYLSRTRGLAVTPDNLLISHGAQMSIYLSGRLLLEPGSFIVAGKPGYLIANRAFTEAGAQVLEINVDDQGIDTDALEEICRQKKVSAVYVIPHHHYPTTVTLSVERRMKLLDLSNRYAFTIIEDDYDYDYHYASSPYLPLASGNHSGNVIYIGSFSKILGPTLRMGFMVAPKNFIGHCTALRKAIDAGGDGYMQNALASLIKNSELSRHLKRAKKVYHHRRDFLDKLLKEKLYPYGTYTLPTGGMAIWITLRSQYPVERLQSFPHLQIKGVYPQENAFRFGFASLDENELETSVSLLKEALDTNLPATPPEKPFQLL